MINLVTVSEVLYPERWEWLKGVEIFLQSSSNSLHSSWKIEELIENLTPIIPKYIIFPNSNCSPLIYQENLKTFPLLEYMRLELFFLALLPVEKLTS